MSLKNPNPVSKSRPKRIALVIANAAVSSTTGWPVGFWWSELTHPYFVFTETGYFVEIFSPNGGPCEADQISDPRDASGYSRTDLISAGFIASDALRKLIQETRPVQEIDISQFDAIVVTGGQSPMFTFGSATNLQAKFVEFYEEGKVAAALCHGVSLLRYLKLSNGTPLATGKTLTGFANVEEDFADAAAREMGLLAADQHVMPWRVQDAMVELGANYVSAGLWRPFAVRDGNLITGQQNFSGIETANCVVEAVGR